MMWKSAYRTLIKCVRWIMASLDMATEGMSAKKATAALFSISATKLHWSYANWALAHNDWTLLPTVLGADFTFIALLLGISAIQNGKTGAVTPATGMNAVVPPPDPKKDDIG